MSSLRPDIRTFMTVATIMSLLLTACGAAAATASPEPTYDPRPKQGPQMPDADPTSAGTKDVCFAGTDHCIEVLNGIGKHTLSANVVGMLPGFGGATAGMRIVDNNTRCIITKLFIDPALPQSEQDALIRDKEVKATLEACDEIVGQPTFVKASYDGKFTLIDTAAGIIAAQESPDFLAVSGLNQKPDILDEVKKIQRPLDLSNCLVQKVITEFIAQKFTIPIPPQDAHLVDPLQSGCSQ